MTLFYRQGPMERRAGRLHGRPLSGLRLSHSVTQPALLFLVISAMVYLTCNTAPSEVLQARQKSAVDAKPVIVGRLGGRELVMAGTLTVRER